jgi:hypothetical protein
VTGHGDQKEGQDEHTKDTTEVRNRVHLALDCEVLVRVDKTINCCKEVSHAWDDNQKDGYVVVEVDFANTILVLLGDASSLLGCNLEAGSGGGILVLTHEVIQMGRGVAVTKRNANDAMRRSGLVTPMRRDPVPPLISRGARICRIECRFVSIQSTGS